MKKNLLAAIVAIILVVFSAQPGYAGFITTRHNTTEQVARHQAAVSKNSPARLEQLKALIRDRFRPVFSSPAQDGEIQKRKIAWQNIASLGLASLGLFSAFLGFAGVISASGWSALAAAAILFGLLCGVGGIVFGIIGMRHGRKWRFRGFALAGLILGCFDIFFLLLVATLAALIA